MGPIEVVSAIELCIPLYMVVSYVAIISICMLLGRVQLGLAISFIFVLYMGYFYNRSLLLKTVEGSATSVVIYLSLGLIILVLAILSFLSSPK